MTSPKEQTTIYLDKNGKPLKGAALQSHLKKLQSEYWQTQSVDINHCTEEEKNILNSVALTEIKKQQAEIAKQEQRQETIIKVVQSGGAIVAVGCFMGILTLFIRPNDWMVGAGLGAGIAGGVLASKVCEDERK